MEAQKPCNNRGPAITEAAITEVIVILYEHRIFLDNFLGFPEAHLITGKKN